MFPNVFSTQKVVLEHMGLCGKGCKVINVAFTIGAEWYIAQSKPIKLTKMILEKDLTNEYCY